MTTNKYPTEHAEQRDFIRWFRKQYPSVRIFAIPNGGGRSKSEALRLRLEGVSAGVPDLYIPAWSLWIEMKRQKGGRVSPAQKDWHAYLQSIGDQVLVCKGCKHAIESILSLTANNA